ncbi:cobalt-precorrin-5B (C(1))-methyltransferase CbiD [uncultured Odoribacter sp.]|uniref:cobalt-precorrin-5B (C(1))-methyltransferase CbiD n=1 Tax=uncultured Odoribacter sp. TaxID=876416 RepID=UPI0026220659|nr:cobalt-precorrin-5B (C(1))-methyltransferase CbiD [uncultured Odoribacter sp.]
MILVFGGTTEGRIVLQLLDGAGKKYYYSTKGERQRVESHSAERLTGGMDATGIVSFCREKGIGLLVDAAHPFAVQLRENIRQAAMELDIPVIRYERTYPPRDTSFVWCESWAEIIAFLRSRNIGNLLALTGVQTIPRLEAYWRQHNCWFRVWGREQSLPLAEKYNFPVDRLLYYEEGEEVGKLIERIRPDAVLTKESGTSGFFEEKVRAAVAKGIPVIVLKRPLIPETFYIVRGENGFRHQLERLLPGFFPLKTGYTTGSCACAAAKAALITLLTGKVIQSCRFTLPCGEEVELPVKIGRKGEGEVTYTVIKDAGDDPDVTNGCEVSATVNLNTAGEIRFLQGEGVGRVTLPGLGLEMGAPAINPVPRRMMREEIQKLLTFYKISEGVDVTLSVAGGRELALKTFNPKLGIEGGISIIGTSGVVKPFSAEAFIATIRKEIQVARALGCAHIVINSGAKSERILKEHFPELPVQAFVHYGNYIGKTLEIAGEEQIARITMGIMIGKAVKLAEGHGDTHSRHVLMNRDFIIALAQEAGAEEEVLEKIRQITLARELWLILPPAHPFFDLLVQKCQEVCTPLFGSGCLEIILIPETGEG